MQYGLLRQRNPAYVPRRWEELSDLYVGGYPLLDKASKYMPRFVGENAQRYAERLAASSYVNHFGQITDFFVANLFSQELVVTAAADAPDPDTTGSAPHDDGFYDAFAHDADLRGTTLVKVLRQLFTTALIKGKALLAADLPALESRAVNLAEENAVGASRGYVFEVPAEQLVDWEYDDRGRFAWAILERVICRRASPLESRNLLVEEFKVWTQDGDVARWDLYRTAPHKPSQRIGEDVDVPRVGGGRTSFRQIPLLELSMAPGLWVGNKVGCLSREHFQRRSALNSAENKSLFAIPFVKLGPEISAPGDALPSEVQQNPNRGRDPRAEFNRRGYVVLGKDDDIGFREPEGRAYDLIDKQLDKLVDEMFRVVHQMAASVSATTTALGRAAASKAEDRSATEVVLGAYGALIRDFAKRIYDCIAAARGEHVVWTPHGLDKFDLEDRDGILKEALAVDSIAIPSATFKKVYKTKLAFALVGNVPPETQDVIREEIEAGVEAEAELREVIDQKEEDEEDEEAPPSRSTGRAA
jgi:hypothetical protein